ncbi:MAG: Bifunctional NAD(P)H-hydrate repair enzyme [Verrucomicrobiales bacterium]|nr:Bifunctional NAD(P)H-hydrate repair enzyme [Verrucomicrobiales bacterium]
MSLPVISVAQMREWEESTWCTPVTECEVMANAGRAVARHALAMTAPGSNILVLAGKGHNGDDARLASGSLADRKVRLLNIVDPAKSLEELRIELERVPCLLIDGLFGVGINRPLNHEWIELIQEINVSGIPVLAIDVPSGLNADSGETEGAAVYAQTTVTFGAPKRGQLYPGSFPFVGSLVVEPEIGLVRCPFSSELQWTEASDFKQFPPARRVDGHKGTFGHVCILAGSRGYHGAAVLAARAALRARPGLVSLYTHPDCYIPVASQLQAAMVHSWTPEAAFSESCSAVVVGPGLAGPELGEPMKEAARELWQSFPMPVVFDASALDWLKPGTTPLNSRRVITPHPGEAARLLQTTTEVIQTNRVAALRELSSRYGNCWVVLKGHQTMVGRTSGDIYVNPSGNPFMAQGGTGDILSGYLGGLLAQPRLQANPLRTIRYGVWRHGASADSLLQNRLDWTTEDLAAAIGT